jgi:glycosyltransferase involved in cell wall biosynthesis
VSNFGVPIAHDVKRKYRFHLLGLVHLPVSERYMGCAFTQKIVKMSKMLLSLGHEVYLYGAESSDAPCTEFIQTHTLSDIRQQWGNGDNRFDIGYDWKGWGFRHDFNLKRTKTTLKFYDSAAVGIRARKRDDDFLLLMQGVYQKPVADMVNLWLTTEPGIGYRGSYARFRAFESAYLMNFTYGSEHPKKSINGHYYDRVIPNYFEAKDFPFQPEKEDYFFFIGRMIKRKGVHTAADAVNAIGGKLILAGQKDSSLDISRLPDCCEFIGYIDPDERAELMGKAKGVFVPTKYLEAFGGVNVEAQLCGTPAITTNFGVFPETVVHGKTGFVCDTLADFVEAAHNVDKLNPQEIRDHAERYLTDNVQWEFQKWWDDLYQLYLSAHETEHAGQGWSYLGD